MKSINTLVDDIYKVLEDGVQVDDKQLEELGHSLALMLKDKLGEYKVVPKQLRMSQLGTTCNRKLWYKYNIPEQAEKMEGKVRLKLLYGHILEELVLWLARISGHEVKGSQNEVEINGVKGHSDGFVDGVLVDVKSANSRSFQKFEKHQLETDDPFGYIEQVNAYLYANKDNPDLKVKKQLAFLAVDKELGNLKVDIYNSNGVDYEKKVQELQDMVSQEKPPNRGHMPQADGKSGNMKLVTPCSYCEFKNVCYPNLRTFIYSNGPRFLTHVEKIPDVPEVINV